MPEKVRVEVTRDDLSGDRLGLPIQPIDATQAANRSAGVS
jgi:hypothetical protein